MAIKRRPDGKWYVDIQPVGRGGRRFRKVFLTHEEAKAWYAWVTVQVIKDVDWLPERKDNRPMLSMAKLWYVNYGKQLKSGEDTYERIKAAIKAMKSPTVSTFTTTRFIDYRSKRLEDGLSVATLNREHAYLRAMINELKRLGYWEKENPLKNLKKFRERENELAYLTLDQIVLLFSELEKSTNEDVYLVARICLATGARWSEAQNLTKNRVSDQKIQYADTKSGRNRTIPITKDLQAALEEQAKKNPFERRLFKDCYSAFRVAIRNAEIYLPKGQLTHVLRHTFASHFMMSGGNILVLQRALGHADLKTTMRYAHFSPDHLEDVKRRNPVSLLTVC